MIADLLDRPIAFHRAFVRITGSASVTVAVFLSQALYWSKRTTDLRGFYKTCEEWEDETGITKKGQISARLKLVKSGILEEHYERLAHKMWFKLNMVRLMELIQNDALRSDERELGEVTNGDLGKLPKGTSSNVAESTSEITYREHESHIDSSEQEGEQKELIPIETSEEAHKQRMVEHMKSQKKGALVKKTARAIREGEAGLIFANYPNQREKAAGQKAISLKLNKHDFEMLMKKTKEHARAMRDRDPKFIPLAKNWFRNDGFLEVEKATLPDESRNQPHILSATERRAQIEAKYGYDK